jgi:hypothetical protein
VNLVGPSLSAAGIEVISVKARHRNGASVITEAVVLTEADAQRLRDWAATSGVSLECAVRVGTAEEIEDWKYWQENL